MDPCSFVRVLVGNLALKIPVASRPDRSGVHPSSTPCYCKITLHNLPCQTAPLPILSLEDTNAGAVAVAESGLASVFHLSRVELERLAGNSIFAGKAKLQVAIYTGRRGTTCGIYSGRLLGKVKVPMDLKAADGKAVVYYSGWVNVGKSNKGPSAQVHITVKSEPDPRFVFEFGGEPECSPHVFQIQGNLRQPVFTCKFSCRNPAVDRNVRSRSLPTEMGSARSWLKAFGSEKEKPNKERKGWSVTVHDLSGSPVAMASMVTPFVASPGTDRVSRSNPGAWLILRPGDGTWKPWGRLEAWRERGGGNGSDALGYRFELLPDATTMTPSAAGVSLAESAISMSKGGRFLIDLTSSAGSRGCSPGGSPKSSGDFGYALWPFAAYRGFVMSSTVAGEGRPAGAGGPVVEVGVQHVGCTEDAAAFIALSAAIDLSVDDACRLFSNKLRNELQPRGTSRDGGFL
ncbi:LOW QUALITY PROTEIN: uncharacterized protein LOC110017896 [Phalaenopsis equestris]|uniref:LOW QUALITY PROTEIN: uncharacterized protein LOC110017896 n=1 Tax=Phalaenopsis equestris TaxID=78828 RepID=UPI0009E64E5A|nr:LOW QUALITY PROTEIN: uncharacterized protein LOC110017896 [Phalaenopsis equestris]